MKITCCGFGAKCGCVGASGLSVPSSPARPSVASRCEMTAGIRIEPLNRERIICRRENRLLLILSLRSLVEPAINASVHVQKLVAAQYHAQVARQRFPV